MDTRNFCVEKTKSISLVEIQMVSVLFLKELSLEVFIFEAFLYCFVLAT